MVQFKDDRMNALYTGLHILDWLSTKLNENEALDQCNVKNGPSSCRVMLHFSSMEPVVHRGWLFQEGENEVIILCK